jgi:hypothetical protein
MRFIPYIVLFVVQLYAFVEAASVKFPRLMPRWSWMLVTFFVPVIGAILWFFGGRPKGNRIPNN